MGEFRSLLSTIFQKEPELSMLCGFVWLLIVPGDHLLYLRRTIVDGVKQILIKRDEPLSNEERDLLGQLGSEALQCSEVLRVPFKKATRRATRYLESAEVSAILSQPDRSTVEGQRDHALISLLYNTGARVQEALDLRLQDIYFKSPAHVRLMGKGRKERISPIWPETAALVTALIRRQPRKPDEPIFLNRYWTPLTASGFRFRLRQYVEAAAKTVPTISKKRVTPLISPLSTLPDYVGSRNRTAFYVNDLALIMRSPRQFARHSLTPASGCSEGEKTAPGGS